MASPLSSPRSPVPMRALRRNPERRVAERQSWSIIAFGALCCAFAVTVAAQLTPGAAGADADLVVLVGALAFGAGVAVADRLRRSRH